jgi:hypothetical protein
VLRGGVGGRLDAAARAETPVPGGDSDWRGQGLIKDEVLAEPTKMHDIIDRAKNDPFKPVRIIASKISAELEPAETP